MPVQIYRVDDRLIHGQVVEAWVPEYGITEIAVISDEVKKNTMRQTIMRFSTPDKVKLIFLGLEEALVYLKEKAPSSPEKILALMSNLTDAAKLVKAGMAPEILNIGGMHYSAGKIFSIGKAIFLNEEDCSNLKFLNDKGVKMEGKGVPNDRPLNILEAIK